MTDDKTTTTVNGAAVGHTVLTSDSDNPNVTMETSSADLDPKQGGGGARRGFQFWAIIAALCVTGILSALENTVVTTSLPVIVENLDIGESYIWITNIFFLTSAAVQPLFGQLANIFGRRWLALPIVALFTLGSGICGGATNGAMLIAGRAVQGMGSGGINMIVDVIVSDLVPLRERGNFMAIVLGVYSIGTSLGPFVGGAIVDSTTWRWVFYMNLPVGGVSLVMLFAFLNVNVKKEMSFLQKLKRIDYVGNFVIITSTIAVLIGLTYGGTRFAWSSWRIILALVLGLLGLALFMALETSKFIVEPVVPPRVFANRTSAAIFVATFLNSALLYWVMFFLPVYFQAVLGSSPARSGVQLLPLVLIALPAAIIAVLLLTKFGKYKPLHLMGFAICTIGLGLFTLLDRHSSMAEWVIYQMICGFGSGFVLNTLLPACQAGLDESDQAAATATWSFIRSFGSIWGVAIPAAIFNNRFDQVKSGISDPSIRKELSNGRAYQYASAAFINSFAEPLKTEIINAYTSSLKRVWEISIVFGGAAFLLVFIEKQIKLRTMLDTDYGLSEKGKKQIAEGSAEEGNV